MTTIGFEPVLMETFIVISLVFVNLIIFAVARIGYLQIVIGFFTSMIAILLGDVAFYPLFNFMVFIIGMIQLLDVFRCARNRGGGGV